MSVELLSGVILPPSEGENNAIYTTPLTDEFEKLKSDLGFVKPEAPIPTIEERTELSHVQFDLMTRVYVNNWLEETKPVQTGTDITPYRSILVNVAQLYYERQYFRPDRHTAADRARDYEYKEYLRTVDDDIRYLGEPSNPHLDSLLRGTDRYYDMFPKHTPTRALFRTNILRVLTKIDPNIAALYNHQKKTTP